MYSLNIRIVEAGEATRLRLSITNDNLCKKNIVDIRRCRYLPTQACHCERDGCGPTQGFFLCFHFHALVTTNNAA